MAEATQAPVQGGGKKKRRKNQEQPAAVQENIAVQEEAKRVSRAADTNAEVNILDSVNMPLNDPNIRKFLLCYLVSHSNRGGHQLMLRENCLDDLTICHYR